MNKVNKMNRIEFLKAHFILHCHEMHFSLYKSDLTSMFLKFGNCGRCHVCLHVVYFPKAKLKGNK